MATKDALLFKQKIVSKVLEQLEAEMQVMANAAAVAREAATHEESVAEDKYDTRGLEASYLAGAQAKRAHELGLIIEAFKILPLKKFTASTPIAQSCYVELESDTKNSSFFVAPNGGGIVVEVDATKVQVVTPSSRLGAELLGKHKGDAIELKIGDKVTEYEIIDVS